MKIPVFLPVTREFGFQRRVRSWRRSRTRPASPSPHPERGDRCHVAAGAIAANRDVLRIGAEFGGVRCGPAALVERRQ
jgi:hypothetical protein